MEEKRREPQNFLKNKISWRPSAVKNKGGKK